MSDVPFTLDVAQGFGPVADAFRANFTEASPGEIDIGAQFCAYRHGEPLVRLVGGWFDRKRSRALDGTDLVSVFSSGKAVAALAVALCVERGQLLYDAPLSAVWPEFAAQGKARLTLAECLSHQAGLSGITDPEWTPRAWLDWERTCATLAAQAPIFPPGSASGYHPVTYGFLAGEPVRRATSTTLGEMVREDLAPDLDVHIGLPPELSPRCAEMRKPSALPDFGAITPATDYAFLKPWSSPGGVSREAWRAAELAGSNTQASADGLARLMQLAVDGTRDGRGLLSAPTLDAFRAERVSGPDRVLPFELSIAAGVMRNSHGFYGPNPDTVGHSGWGGSCVLADPDGLHAAYAMTRQSASLMGDPRSLALIRALYACL